MDEGLNDLMNKKLLTVFVLLVACFLLLIYIFLNFKDDGKLLSPWLGGRVANNLWFPQGSVEFLTEEPLQITAQAAYFIELGSGRVLYEQDKDLKLPIASLVKIMTVIVALENNNLADEVKVSQRAAGMEPDSMLLKAGETLSVEEILYGIFLVSANDGAEALAENHPEGREGFIKQMNAKAKQLGLKDTLFINPTGLQEDGEKQYSTAFEVAVMSRYAIKYFPYLVDITSKDHVILPQTSTHQDYDLYSGINLLTTYPGVVGFKTGYTPEAGLTLVTLAKRENYQVLGVLLGSSNRREEARQLLDYSFQKLGL